VIGAGFGEAIGAGRSRSTGSCPQIAERWVDKHLPSLGWVYAAVDEEPGRTVSAVEVVITCVERPEARVRLHDCVAFDQDITTMGVETQACGIEARLGVELLDHDGLARFFQVLAESYSGWEGERAWRSYHNELAVVARFHSRGHVELRWGLTYELETHGSWSAAVTTWIYAGEDMRRLADDLQELFDARGRT